ncbi:TPA: blue light-responsive regulator BluF, partial [Escherichia coli]
NDHFAFHPIVDPLSRRIIAFEAIVQKNEDSPSAIAVGQRKDGEIYKADLKSKALAFAMAHALELGDKMISINLLPMTLVNEPDAVSFLLDEIKANALVPEQIIVEFTESEVISRFDEFAEAIKSLKAAGISVAIDHFGAGFAGLLLLSRFQPDRIKISQELITNVHKSGPRQAIIQAIIKCCTSLEIQVSAMGVTTPEEWMWLESAGIEMFQGDLFAKAKLNGIPSVAWPEKK